MISRNKAWQSFLRFLRQRRRRECLRKAVRSVFYNKPCRGFDFPKYFEHKENFKSLRRAFDKLYGRRIPDSGFNTLFEENIRNIA